MVELDPIVIAVLAGGVIPILTGLATKYEAGNNVKAFVAMILAVLSGFLAEIVTAGSFEVKPLIVNIAVALVVNVASYLGIYKPMGATDNVPGQVVTANFGINSVPVFAPDLADAA
jgi:hypothetical protein